MTAGETRIRRESFPKASNVRRASEPPRGTLPTVFGPVTLAVVLLRRYVHPRGLSIEAVELGLGTAREMHRSGGLTEIAWGVVDESSSGSSNLWLGEGDAAIGLGIAPYAVAFHTTVRPGRP